MAEDNKPNGTQAKATTSTSKTTPAKTTVEKSTSTTTKTTAKEAGEQVLALSTQPRTLLPQNRPIEPSSIEIVHTYSSVGSDRPVSKGAVKFSSSLAISGNRPIAASTLQVSESYIVMGNRPVASNESDETASLMGYLD
ncbi:MAG: hypothetical protein RLZZ574_767 [Cyanobacteriota bacterium]|jgi:hypothetical protein